MNRKRISVIGGGAAGLAAAIAAAREGCEVFVFESAERVGNSIKVTGDGRCNIANTRTVPDVYRNTAFVERAFSRVSPEDALGFLRSCGLLLREEAQGRLYPQANKSTSVIDALRQEAARRGVSERCGTAVARVRPTGDAWEVVLEGGARWECDSVILACGGGRIPRGLLPEGVRATDPVPVLAPMRTGTAPLKGLDKVRAKCSVAVRGQVEDGEVTFRNYGISGIAAFNMTRWAQPGDRVVLDFLPFLQRGESLPMLKDRLALLCPRDWLEITCGMLLPLVARAVLRQAGIQADSRPAERDLEAFDCALRGFSLEYLGVGDEKLAQVRRGGVEVPQVDPLTMEVLGFPGLYCTGEMLDVDGPCGGYNLHWAWVSGLIAGKAAAHD